MELPFELDWTPPRLTRWNPFRNPLFWLEAVAVCVAFAVLALTHPWAPPSDVPPAVLAVSSVPAGATVSVDGRERGHTPLDVRLAPGSHEVSLQQAGDVDMTYRLALASDARTPLHAVLWRQEPTVTPLRSPLPGAQVVNATFLSDGRVSLTLGLPSGDERQLWLLGANQIPRSIGPPDAEGTIASTPDGK